MTAPVSTAPPVDPMLDPANRLKLQAQQRGPNALQNAVQSRDNAYNSSNPYATPDNVNYWKTQDNLRQNAVQQLPGTNVTPAANVLNSQTDTNNMLTSINQFGKSALQGVQGSVQTQQLAAADRQNRAWQKQQEDAYAKLNSQYSQQIASMQYTGNATGTSGAPGGSASGQTIAAGQGNYNNSLDNQIAGWARQAGWQESQIPMVVAIAHAESGGRPNAVNDQNSNGSIDRGLMQINSIHGDLLKTGDVMNPVDNLKMALSVYNDAGGSWKPWSTFNNGAYNNFLSTPTFSATPVTGVGGQVNNFESQLRMNLVGKGLSYQGLPYIWGGTDLSQGVDCSGLVQSLYSQFGINLPRTAREDANTAGYSGNVQGTRTSVSNLQPGDLIAWQGGYAGPNVVGHVAIYLGNNNILESPDVGLTVRTRALRSNEHDLSQGGSLIGIHLGLPGDK